MFFINVNLTFSNRLVHKLTRSLKHTQGEIDHADLLTSMDEQILRAEEEALSRKVIMEKVEKWILSRDEERWLEEYMRVSFFYC